MKESVKLGERLEAIEAEIKALDQKAVDTPGYEYTPEEDQKYLDLIDERSEIQKTKMPAALNKEKREAIQAVAYSQSQGKSAEDKELSKMGERYSIGSAMKRYHQGHSLQDGVEAELQKIGEDELRAAGIPFVEGVVIPQRFIQPHQPEWRTTLETGVAATAGDRIDTELDGVVAVFRPKLKMLALGAEYKRSQVSNYSFVRQTSASTFAWRAEKAAAAETNPAYEKITMTPKGLSGYVNITSEQLMQDKFNLDADIMSEINLGIGTASDLAFIAAAGASDDPTGMLNISGINDVAIGTDGGAPTRNHLINLWKELALDNVPDVSAINFLTNPIMIAKLMKTLLDAGSGRFVLENDRKFMGYQFHDSNQVPSNLVKGVSSDCSAIILGDFSKALVVQWGGIVIMKDPYTQGKNALVNYIAHSWWDFNVRRKEAFAAIQDARDV